MKLLRRCFGSLISLSRTEIQSPYMSPKQIVPVGQQLGGKAGGGGAVRWRLQQAGSAEEAKQRDASRGDGPQDRPQEGCRGGLCSSSAA